ncbi:MAG: hypothetical protein QM726_11220 [Chitinophagaceae bacterium]
MADFDKTKVDKTENDENDKNPEDKEKQKKDPEDLSGIRKKKQLNIDGLQYHINIILPDTKEQAVYDAIFKSLRDHLG